MISLVKELPIGSTTPIKRSRGFYSYLTLETETDSAKRLRTCGLEVRPVGINVQIYKKICKRSPLTNC